MWARAAFKDDIASFEAFVDAVAIVRDDRGYDFSDDDIRTGSAMFDFEGKRVEWIFEGPAAECATTAVTTWRAIVEKSDPIGGGGGNQPDALPRPTATKAWIIATSAWGGVLLEASKDKLVLIALPTVDRAAVPQFPPGLISAVIVMGDVPAVAIAKAAGVAHIYSLAGTPIDGLEVRAFEAVKYGPLTLDRIGESILGTWTNNITVLVGPAIPISTIAEIKPIQIVGRVYVDDAPRDGLLDAVTRLRKVMLLANIPDSNARAIAEMFSQIGVASDLMYEPLARKMQIIAHLLMDEMDKADAIAVEGIAVNDEAEDMHFQRAMIALMRGDEALADAELALIDTPQALTSRATLAGMRRDPIARELAAKALAQLPGDAIAIRSAISAHMFTGDPEGAKQLLAEHGGHLDREVRFALEMAIADPGSIESERKHTFPEHAEIALQSITPMIDQGQLEAAAILLRRVRVWDPSNYAITVELGVALAKQKKFAEAIAVYDETIARGGSAELLRFNRGNCYLNLGKLDEATADYRACLAIKPDWDGPRQNLAAVEANR
jgi:tetratricopeptide (TPR) repeat protein